MRSRSEYGTHSAFRRNRVPVSVDPGAEQSVRAGIVSEAERREGGAHICGNGRSEDQFRCIHGVGKSQAIRVQGLTRQAPERRATIQPVSHQRVTDTCHMHPDLMGSASLQAAFNEATGLCILDQTEFRRGGLASMLTHIHHGHPEPISWVPPDCRIDQ